LGATLGRVERLRAASEFRRVFRRGTRLEGRLFALIAAEHPEGPSRLGLAAGRGVGRAKKRNRAKRLLREAFRRNKRLLRTSFDIVLIPKREIVMCTQSEVDREYQERLRQLDAQAKRRAGSSSAASSH